jgi:hypothetical protein
MNPLHARSGPGIDTIFVVLLSFPDGRTKTHCRQRRQEKRKSNRSSKSCQIRKRPLIIKFLRSSPLKKTYAFTGSQFTVKFLSVRRTQKRLMSALLICRHVLGVPACALIPICFFNHALKAPLTCSSHIFSGLARQAGLPACALIPICLFNHALNSPSNLFLPYVLRSRMAGGFAVNPEPLSQ